MIVKDVYNCVVNIMVIVNEFVQFMVIFFNYMDVFCYGVCDGIVIVIIGGGIILYSYNWLDGIIGVFIFGFCVGIYIVDVMDVYVCMISQSFMIIELLLLVIVSFLVIDVFCNGVCDGIIVVNLLFVVSYSIDNGVIY